MDSRAAAMLTMAHLGKAGPHPVIASAARELLNRSENERSGVLSTAMSFLGLYRDSLVAQVTRRCDWRIRDLVDSAMPVTLYLVVPPSDISRTKPLVRLILNQVGQRLTEELEDKRKRHKLLLLDEFPALERLDFLKSALVHGRLRHPVVPDRAVAQPDREGLRAEQCHPQQLPRPRFRCRERPVNGEGVSDALGTATSIAFAASSFFLSFFSFSGGALV